MGIEIYSRHPNVHQLTHQLLMLLWTKAVGPHPILFFYFGYFCTVMIANSDFWEKYSQITKVFDSKFFFSLYQNLVISWCLALAIIIVWKIAISNRNYFVKIEKEGSPACGLEDLSLGQQLLLTAIACLEVCFLIQLLVFCPVV